MAKTQNSLAQTKGTFQLQGQVVGTARDSFYTQRKTRTGKDFRTVRFGVRVSKNEIVYVDLNGMPQDKVYFYKTEKTVRGQKSSGQTVAEPWENRNKFRGEGYRLIGVNVGLEKVFDQKGKEMNDKKNLVPFDACEYISKNLKDGMSVFVRGNVEYSTYKDQAGNEQHSSKLIINQLSLLTREVDFDAEDFERRADFTQSLVYTGIEKVEEEFIMSTKIVNYSTIEDVAFTVKNPNLAIKIKKELKPYTFMNLWGEISTVTLTDQVSSTADDEDDDGWGTSNKMDRVTSPYRRVLVVTGIDKNSFDTGTYTEKAITAEIERINSEKDVFENQSTKPSKRSNDEDDWGSTSSDVEDDDEDDDDSPW